MWCSRSGALGRRNELFLLQCRGQVAPQGKGSLCPQDAAGECQLGRRWQPGAGGWPPPGSLRPGQEGLAGTERGIKCRRAQPCTCDISGSCTKPLGAIVATSWPMAGPCSPSQTRGGGSGVGPGEPLGPMGGWASAPSAGPGLGECIGLPCWVLWLPPRVGRGALLSAPPGWAATHPGSWQQPAVATQPCLDPLGTALTPWGRWGPWACQAGRQLLHAGCWVPVGMEGAFVGASPRQGTGTIPGGNG